MTRDRVSPISLLTYPYQRLQPLTKGPSELRALGREPGAALVWSLEVGRYDPCTNLVCDRPGGLSLIVVLPPAEDVSADPDIVSSIQRVRPHGILPHHPDLTPHDFAQVLRRPPSDLGGEVTDYLRWRGLAIDRDTAHVLRCIVDLSGELRSISAVSRGMYLSRRALGRRLLSRGLPVPSHWLQVARLLRVILRLQNSEATVSSIAFDLGYPDGFSVSNQMERLIGFRPSDARVRLGWEWVFEAWLRREADRGGLTPTGVTGRMRPAWCPEPKLNLVETHGKRPRGAERAGRRGP
jgi:AraC-like DNA-binding protein